MVFGSINAKLKYEARRTEDPSENEELQEIGKNKQIQTSYE